MVCDGCGEQAASPDLTVERLRRVVGYVERGGRDLCPACADGDLLPDAVARGG
jgi:hypothetical protein